jgi:hypothetical protein
MGMLFRGFRAAAEHCARQVVAEKTRLRDEQLAAEQSTTPGADSTSTPPEGESPATP